MFRKRTKLPDLPKIASRGKLTEVAKSKILLKSAFFTFYNALGSRIIHLSLGHIGLQHFVENINFSLKTEITHLNCISSDMIYYLW